MAGEGVRTSLRLEIPNFARFIDGNNATYGNEVVFRNLKWRLAAVPRWMEQGGKSLGMFVRCEGPENERKTKTWSSSVDSTLRLVVAFLNYERTITHTFTHESKSWGFSDFVTSEYVTDPANGILVDDKITLEADVVLSRHELANQGAPPPRPPVVLPQTPPASSSSLPVPDDTDLQCSVCLEYFSDPRVLPCGHTFCDPCCFQTDGLRLTNCPTCRAKISPFGDLPVNFVVKNLVEAQKKIESGMQKCGDCNSPRTLQAFYYCTHCAKEICSDCVIKQHGTHLDQILNEKAVKDKTKRLSSAISAAHHNFQTQADNFREDFKSRTEKMGRRLQSALEGKRARLNESLSGIQRDFGLGSEVEDTLELVKEVEKAELGILKEIGSALDKFEEEFLDVLKK